MSDDICVCCQNTLHFCKIHCTECTTADVYLCFQCYACGAEIGPHKRSHNYEILGKGYVPLFDSPDSMWRLHEEGLLLDAVEQYGFGNWEDVSNHVRTRTAEDCEQHYYTYYIRGKIGEKTVPKKMPENIIDHTTLLKDNNEELLSTGFPIQELTLQEQREFGYLPLRNDFEIEYDNDAEKLVSDLTLNYHEDDEIDSDVKLMKIDSLRERLLEREKRKDVARVHDIIFTVAPADKRLKSSSKKKSKAEKNEVDLEINEKYRIFSQFQNAIEQKEFVQNLRKIKQLKTRIKELQRFRRNGITKFSECSKFNNERLRNDKKREQKRKLLFNCKSAKHEKKSNNHAIDISEDKKNGSLKKDRLQLELLSDSEKKLCSSIDMKPNTYLTIKTCIIKDYLQRKQGLPVKMRYPSHLDKVHRRKILTFLTHNGWIGSI